MGIDGGKDPMVASNWWNDVDHCVFTRNDAESVFGTGHASFVRSPGEQIIYPAVNLIYLTHIKSSIFANSISPLPKMVACR